MQLRPYQSRTIDDVLSCYHDNPLVVAPTGAGKTTVGVEIAKALAADGVLWVAHRSELLDQARDRFEQSGIGVGMIKAGRHEDPHCNIQVGSVDTLRNRPPLDVATLIIDEAHRSEANSYKQVRPIGSRVIGLTATPYRLDGKGLGNTYTRIVEAASVSELITDGYLIEPEVWVVDTPSGIKTTAGEYNQASAASVMNTPEKRADIVAEFVKRGGERALCFATTIEHSREICQALVDAGIGAEHVDGGTPGDEREAVLNRLRSGETRVVCNCMLFTEGFDLPELDTLIIARPTQSLNLHMQMLGRVMRPATDRAVVNDHAGNSVRLGLVTQAFNYTLEEAAKTTPTATGLKVCGNCYRMYSDTRCPECGTEPERSEVETLGVDGEAGMKRLDDRRLALWDQWCEEQAANGYKPSYPRAKYYEEFDEWPATYVKDDAECLFVAATAGMDEKRLLYKGLLEVAIDKGFKHGWASVRYKDAVGSWPKGFVGQVKAELGIAAEDWSRVWQ